MGKDYEKIISQVLFEILKGNISVEAVICRKEDKFCSVKDGFPVIAKEELKKEEIDYVIVASSAFFEQIRNEALLIGFESNQIVDGLKYLLPLFDFQRYAQLIENPVTILSDDCWGGICLSSIRITVS